MTRLQQAEREMREHARTGGGPIDVFGAQYLDALIDAEHGDTLTDDQFFDGLVMLRDYLLKRPI